jgi:hypothetical protein
MTLHQRIDRHADTYKHEGAQMAQRAMEAFDRGIARLNRSLGQKKRYQRQKAGG